MTKAQETISFAFSQHSVRWFIRIAGMTHVRTSPYYPQPNGKLERWHGSLKRECIGPGTPLSLDDARRLVERYVAHYHHVRLHSGAPPEGWSGYITPADKLGGRERELFEARDRKLEAARRRRKERRAEQRKEVLA